MRKINQIKNVGADDPVCQKNRGITLIALIITIIVLLILAMVSISLVMNGEIIRHGEASTSKYALEEEKEKVQLSVTDSRMAANGGAVTNTNLQNALKNLFGEDGYENFTEGTEDDKTIFTFNITNGTGTTYKVYGNGTIAMTNEEGDLWIGLDGTELGEVEDPAQADPDPNHELPTVGDEYTDGYYTYKYGYHHTGYRGWTESELEGWGVRVIDNSLKTYPAIKATVWGKPVVSLNGTFYQCKSLESVPSIPASVISMKATFQTCPIKTAPKIPEGVTDISSAFAGTDITIAPKIPDSVTKMTSAFYLCSTLISTPEIPDNVVEMNQAFRGTSITEMPIIPEKVTNLSEAFADCALLSGEVTIPNSVTNMDECFIRTEKNITMKYYSTCTAAVNYTAPSNVTKVQID